MNSEAPKVSEKQELEAGELIASVDQLARIIHEARTAISSVIFGQDRVVGEAIVALLAGGHILLIGVPGLGKTKLVEIFGTVFGLQSRRVQFTPDLMPADILGSEILEESETGQRTFRFVKGPVFSQLLMADEINRASPRTQSALLQAMQEHRVSVAGEYHLLPSPFYVLATQNPLEQEGTYPLPEAQLDRFLMQIDIGYPDLQSEREILINTTGVNNQTPNKVMDAESVKRAQLLIRQVPVGESVLEAITKLIRLGRPETSDMEEVITQVSWGPGPRAGQALMLGVRARAIIDGRLAPSMDDVVSLALPILRHRMALTFAARAEGKNIENIIAKLCERIIK